MLQWCHTALNTATEKHWALSPFPLLFSISIPPSSHSHPPSHPPLSPLWLTFISSHTSTPPQPRPPPPSLSLCTSRWVSRFHNASEWRKTRCGPLSTSPFHLSFLLFFTWAGQSVSASPAPILFVALFRCCCMLDFLSFIVFAFFFKFVLFLQFVLPLFICLSIHLSVGADPHSSKGESCLKVKSKCAVHFDSHTHTPTSKVRDVKYQMAKPIFYEPQLASCWKLVLEVYCAVLYCLIVKSQISSCV